MIAERELHMRMRIKPRSTVLTLCLMLAASAAFAGDGPAAPPAPSAPPAPAESVPAAAPNPPSTDEDALRAQMDAAHRRMDLANRREAALQAQMDAARRRMEVAAQQLAALSAQMYGPMMERLQVFGGSRHALIGVQLDRSSGTAGARVREVSPGGPAERAGIRTGDLIVAVNGTDVRGKDSARRVVELLRSVKPGDKVNLSVLRDGKSRDLTVTARPDWDDLFLARQFPDLPPPPVKAFAAWGGGPMIIRGPVADMELARLTPGLGRYFGTDTGVLVVRAPPDGALGLKDGDVILTIDGRQPIDSSHVIRILASYDPGEKISMEVMRMHRKIPVATTMPAEPPMSRQVFRIRGGAVLGPGPVVTLRGDDRTL
jgi:predicted metalloprotease with PDZ domain